jgi:hypothetical protein
MLMPALVRAERLWLARTLVASGLVLSGCRSLLGGSVEPIEFLLLSLGLTAALVQIAVSMGTVRNRRS